MMEHALALPPTADEVDEALACIAWPCEGRSVWHGEWEMDRVRRKAEDIARRQARLDRREQLTIRWLQAGVDMNALSPRAYAWLVTSGVTPEDFLVMSERQMRVTLRPPKGVFTLVRDMMELHRR